MIAKQSGGLRVRRTLLVKGWVRAAMAPGIVLLLGLILLFGGGKIGETQAYSGRVYGYAGVTADDLTWRRVIHNLTTKPGFRRLAGLTLASLGALGIAGVSSGTWRWGKTSGEVIVQGKRGVVVEF